MFQTQLINAVLDWERRLEIEKEKRENRRYEPYVNYLAKPQDPRKERPSIFARIFRFGRNRQQTAYHYHTHECCQETQPG